LNFIQKCAESFLGFSPTFAKKLRRPSKRKKNLIRTTPTPIETRRPIASGEAADKGPPLS
jgi:hypothetical protein